MATVPSNDIGIEAAWIVNNPTYSKPTAKTKTKLMLHSTATPGAPAQNFHKVWNKSTASASVEFVLDNEKILELLPIGKNGKGCVKSWHCGDSGNNTHIATEVCEPLQAQLIPVNYYTQKRGGSTNKTYTIQRLQMELEYLGFYTGEIDGSFGPATEAAVKAYQKSVGLTADGSVGKDTRAKLAARKGSYYAYDVEAATPFFNAAYNNAVALFGWLCSYVGARPAEIVCHAEGHAQGIASNHADVNHWFPLHGKTMDNFRQDVASYMNGTWVPLGTSYTATDEYDTNIEQIHDAGIINSLEYWSNIDDVDDPINMEWAHIFIQSAGKYYAGKNYSNAVDALTYAAGLNSPLYWKGNEYTTTNVQFLMIAIAKFANLSQENMSDLSYEEAVDICFKAHLINGVDYWKELTDETLNEGNVQLLMKNAALYFISNDWKCGLAAIENAVGINSPDYWKTAEQYSKENWKFMVKAIATNL